MCVSSSWMCTSKPDGFRVFHLPAVDAGSTCDRFTDCLAVMRGWSESPPGHVPIVVLVEPKDDVDNKKIRDHLPALEAEIRGALPPSRLLTPDDVRGDLADVRTAVTTRCWPVLDAVRGRMLFVLLDHGETRDALLALHPDSAGGVFFVPGARGASGLGVSAARRRRGRRGADQDRGRGRVHGAHAGGRRNRASGGVAQRRPHPELGFPRGDPAGARGRPRLQPGHGAPGLRPGGHRALSGSERLSRP